MNPIALVQSLAGVAEGIISWLEKQGIIEKTQQTPAIVQLPSVRAALLEAEKEAAAKEQAAIEAASKAVEMGGAVAGGYPAIDFQAQMFDIATEGALFSEATEGVTEFISDADAALGTNLGGVTQADAIAGLTASAALINQGPDGLKSAASFVPAATIAGLIAKGGNFGIQDVPNFKGVSIPTFDVNGVVNGVTQIIELFGNASNTPIMSEQTESTLGNVVKAVQLVQTVPTNTMPAGIISKMQALSADRGEFTIEQDFNFPGNVTELIDETTAKINKTGPRSIGGADVRSQLGVQAAQAAQLRS